MNHGANQINVSSFHCETGCTFHDPPAAVQIEDRVCESQDLLLAKEAKRADRFHELAKIELFVTVQRVEHLENRVSKLCFTFSDKRKQLVGRNAAATVRVDLLKVVHEFADLGGGERQKFNTIFDWLVIEFLAGVFKQLCFFQPFLELGLHLFEIIVVRVLRRRHKGHA
jgi:hypothetical protein